MTEYLKLVSTGDPHATSNRRPSLADLAEIEAEWPTISADLRVLDAEIELMQIEDESPFSRRRMVRAVDEWVKAMATRTELLGTPWGDAA